MDTLTVKLCRYSPQVLLSLPTSISVACQKHNSLLFPENQIEYLTVRIYFVVCCYLLAYAWGWGGRVIL